MIQRFKEIDHLVFKSNSALSREILKQKKDRSIIHFNRDSMNTELLFQTIHFVIQLRMYRALTNWCHQFDLREEEKERAIFPVDNKIMTTFSTGGRTSLAISSDNSIWKQDARRRFEIRSAGQWNTAQKIIGKSLRTVSCDSWEAVQNSTWEGRRLGNYHSSMLDIHISSIVSEIPSLDSYSQGTIIGPVLEVQIVKILDGFGREIPIPSIVYPANTSYVVISRETERLVNEIHDHKEKLMSSIELLTAERGSNSNQETDALNGSRKLVQVFPAIYR